MPAQSLQTNYKGKILEAKSLPALPAAVDELTRLMQLPNCSVENLAKVIEKDQALAANVLKMVNSPIYGFPGRINSIKHALVLLGINVIRGIIISSAVFDPMNRYMVGLWEHSTACSLAAFKVAEVTGQEHPEEFSVMGLLHDIGKVVFAMQIPDAKQQIDEIVRQRDIMFMDAENEVLGFSHDRINTWLCDHWNLPLPLKEALVYHHKPLAAQFYPEAAAIVHMADFMCRLFEQGFGGDDNVPPLDPRALRLLKLDHAAVERITGELIDVFSDVSNMSIM